MDASRWAEDGTTWWADRRLVRYQGYTGSNNNDEGMLSYLSW